VQRVAPRMSPDRKNNREVFFETSFFFDRV
jgi:hypothetical protein